MKWEVSTFRTPNRRAGEFGHMGRRAPGLGRSKWLVFGGGVLMVSMMLVALTLKETKAYDPQVKAEPEINEMIAYGSVALVAPVTDVSPGTKLGKVEVRELFWPRDKVPQGAIRNASDVRELFAKVNLPAGQPIIDSNLTPNPPQFGIEKYLRDGDRAITIEVDATSGVEGWATSGAHVDLLLTYTDREDSQKKTKVAVEDTVVLSYNGSTERDAHHSNADNSQRRITPLRTVATVTLAMPFEDALKVQTARAMGRISLMLRNKTDVKSYGEMVYSEGDFRTTDSKKEVKREQADSSAFKGSLRIRNGEGELEQYYLGDDDKWWVQDEWDS